MQNIKLVLHFIVSMGANILMLDVVPAQYKAIAILVFNLAQVTYAYFDTSYAFQKFGSVLRK